jgi:hypothetical protein
MEAATWLADRGLGRPRLGLDFEGSVRHEEAHDLSKLTDAELATLRELMLKAKRGPEAASPGA